MMVEKSFFFFPSNRVKADVKYFFCFEAREYNVLFLAKMWNSHQTAINTMRFKCKDGLHGINGL